MKKMILLLLLIIPVVVTILVYMLAGFISRQITYIGVQSVGVQANGGYTRMLNSGVISEGMTTAVIPSVNVNTTINLASFLEARPQGARWSSLWFEIMFADSIEAPQHNYADPTLLAGGVFRPIRPTQVGTFLELHIGDGLRTLFLIKIMRIV